jgi:hypothetical protein
MTLEYTNNLMAADIVNCTSTGSTVGDDVFTYEIADGNGGTDTATVSTQIIAADEITIDGQTFTTDPNTVNYMFPSGSFTNDTFQEVSGTQIVTFKGVSTEYTIREVRKALVFMDTAILRDGTDTAFEV